MPSVRYYDYGVMRRESERRMYDAQQRTAQCEPFKRVRTEQRRQTRPESGSVMTDQQDALSMDDLPAAEETSEPMTVTAEERRTPAAGPAGVSSEELLIAALLLLAVSEGGNTPLVLALLYLLM